jgi:NADH:ubiquinone oxidoreductase subunit 3 (subunit A)
VKRKDVTDEITEMVKFLDKCKDEMIQGIKAADLAKLEPAETGRNAAPAKRMGVKKGICLFIIFFLVLILAIFRLLGWPEPIKAFKGIYSFIIFLAALLTCLYYLGCLEPIKQFIIKILRHK